MRTLRSSGDFWLDLVQLSLTRKVDEFLPLSLVVHLVNAVVASRCCWCFLTSGCRQLGEKSGCSIHSPPSPFQSGRCNRSNSPAKNWQVRPKLWWISRNLLSPVRGRGQTVGGVKSFIKGPIFAAKLSFGKILMGGFVSEGPAGLGLESALKVALVWVLSKSDGQSIVHRCGGLGIWR